MTEKKKRDELMFNGGPGQTAAAINLAANEQGMKRGDVFYRPVLHHDFYMLHMGRTLRYNRYSGTHETVKLTGRLIPEPDARCQLALYATDEEWALLEQGWILLRDELQRQGWLTTSAAGATKPLLQPPREEMRR